MGGFGGRKGNIISIIIYAITIINVRKYNLVPKLDTPRPSHKRRGNS